ncbi:taste 2 receptor member 7 [Phyllostomus discolor]|uniref:Taste receptor type 2 n=1 Tax=Phyllostomus discolor TaxID=89673 RepID=A0A6J2NH71_9CHIR|nr:taste receptor type 2 member 7-like [Phyllostomus discolor]KAF6122045.1 taste 2 receptor member 7 [Phyllostomus discolor]
MSGEANSTLMIIAVGEFSVGILGNVFIGLINFMDWIKKKKKIASIDLILTSLAVSRICLLCVILLDYFILVLYPDIYATGKEMRIIDFFWTLTNHVNVWFATCLSIFYFFKIANFCHPFFLWMKWRIDRAIPGILLVCSALSVIISLPVTENLNDDFRLCVKTKVKRNLTLRCRENKTQYASIKVLLNLLTLFPFSVSLVSFLLLILSLWGHIKQMQLNATGYRDPSTDAHVGAVKAVVSFLLLFIVYSLSFLVATSSYFIPETELAVVIGELVALIYPSSHSFILILGNNKLRQASRRVLGKVAHVLKRRNF